MEVGYQGNQVIGATATVTV